MPPFNDQQDAKLNDLLNCLQEYIARMPCMQAHFLELKASGVRLTGIEVSLRADVIQANESTPVAAGVGPDDLAWLKSLRIAPDLEAR